MNQFITSMMIGLIVGFDLLFISNIKYNEYEILWILILIFIFNIIYSIYLI